MVYVIEEILGNDPIPEHYQAKVAAEIVFYETPNGGAVFTVGSMGWCGSLAHNGHKNNVARLTANILRRFLRSEPFSDGPWSPLEKLQLGGES